LLQVMENKSLGSGTLKIGQTLDEKSPQVGGKGLMQEQRAVGVLGDLRT
jgi:hypothetical protein